ncbi:MAG: hypothetical protein VX589_20030 [Myxococcota bacterium]|nr:hypothetical protein [Myxococcota bacterium]
MSGVFRISLVATSTLLGALCATNLVHAQETSVPEVIIMLDNSASMNRPIGRPDGLTVPQCTEDFTTRTRVRRGVTERVINQSGAPTFTTYSSRFHMLIRTLAGREVLPISDENKVACYADPTELPLSIVNEGYANLADLHPYFAEEAVARVDPNNPNQGQFLRYMLGQCVPNNPGDDPDNCTPYVLVDGETLPTKFNEDGVLHRFASTIKFGLMTLDDDPNVTREWPDAFGGSKSFGNEHRAGGVDAGANALTAVLARRLTVDVGNQDAPRTPNLGAQAPGTNKPGQLVPGNMGMVVAGTKRPYRVVGESENDITRHTNFVIDQLRDLSAFGFSPLTAFLHDLNFYYRLQNPAVPPNEISNRFGVVADLEYGCRQHIAVLITDGGESNYYANEQCLRNGVNCPAHVGFPYEAAATYVNRMRAQVPNFKLYVIALGVDAQRRAELAPLVAAPTDLIAVNDSTQLRAALTQILRFSDSNRRSRVRPLVISPVEADRANPSVTQYRIVGYSEVVAGDRYGRIEATAFGCGQEAQALEGRTQEVARENVDYAERLVLQLRRNVFGQSPDSENNFQATGRGAAVFTFDGELVGSGAMSQEDFRKWTHTQSGAGAANDPVKKVWEALAGYIGESGRPSEDGSCNPFCGPVREYVRQLGAVEQGDLIAVTPPQLGIDGAAYRRFVNENRERPTLVATGARDGLIHFFRLADGREVFNFVPHRSLASLKSGVANPGVGHLNANGPLTTRHLLMCRTLGEGTDECPAEAENAVFRTIVAGGIGQGGDNLFAIDITEATNLMRRDTQTQLAPANAVKGWNMVSTRLGVGP